LDSSWVPLGVLLGGDPRGSQEDPMRFFIITRVFYEEVKRDKAISREVL